MVLRRSVPFALAVGLAATLAAILDPAASAATHPATAPLRLTLPAPTGPDPIGTVSLHLVQADRPDPFVPGRPREVMVSLTYPARHADRYPTVPYMTAGAWASFEHNRGIPAGSVVPQTAAHEGAPVHRHPDGLPVVLFSPGDTGDRTQNTVLVQELASRGYLVATIDHTHYDDEVEFPGGRVEHRLPVPPGLSDAIVPREQDARFVLDELTAIDNGQNPDAERHRLPEGLRGALDLNRVGMFGHSAGGSTTAATMADDPRIKAGINMDGAIKGGHSLNGLNRPFLLLAREDHTRDTDPSWALFWNNSTGWKRDFRLVGAQHNSYTDAEALFPQVGLLPDQLHEQIGTIDPRRALTIETAYVTSFFDLHLRHRDNHLLDGQSTRLPEMVFEP